MTTTVAAALERCQPTKWRKKISQAEQDENRLYCIQHYHTLSGWIEWKPMGQEYTAYDKLIKEVQDKKCKTRS